MFLLFWWCLFIVLLSCVTYRQVQLFLTLSGLYRHMRMFRKAAFYSRIAAMQFVSPANRQPSWLHCYNLLIRALPGYQLSLDPKEMLLGWFFKFLVRYTICQ